MRSVDEYPAGPLSQTTSTGARTGSAVEEAKVQAATRFGPSMWLRRSSRANASPRTTEDVPPAVRAALHVDPKVQRAILVFMRAQEDGGSMAICDMCTEARNVHLDTSADLDAVPGCNPFVTNPWDARVRPSLDNRRVCDRCLSLNYASVRGKDFSRKAHAFSGIHSCPEDLSAAGHHNNMHLLPVPVFMEPLTMFERQLIAHNSMATMVHVGRIPHVRYITHRYDTAGTSHYPHLHGATR